MDNTHDTLHARKCLSNLNLHLWSCYFFVRCTCMHKNMEKLLLLPVFGRCFMFSIIFILNLYTHIDRVGRKRKPIKEVCATASVSFLNWTFFWSRVQLIVRCRCINVINPENNWYLWYFSLGDVTCNFLFDGRTRQADAMGKYINADKKKKTHFSSTILERHLKL